MIIHSHWKINKYNRYALKEKIFKKIKNCQAKVQAEEMYKITWKQRTIFVSQGLTLNIN